MVTPKTNLTISLRDMIYLLVFLGGMIGNYFALDKRIDINSYEIKNIKETIIPDVRNDFGKDLEDIKNLTKDTKNAIDNLHSELDKVKEERFNSFSYMNGVFDTLRFSGKTTFMYEKNIGELVEVKEDKYDSLQIKAMVEEIKCNLIDIQDIAFLIDNKIKNPKYLAYATNRKVSQ